ncbi:hypothetical protein BJP50_02085 [Paenibacillus odorifer]|nr:hypothetical protein BJP50_02085 [Paenibacillus odorifer]
MRLGVLEDPVAHEMKRQFAITKALGMDHDSFDTNGKMSILKSCYDDIADSFPGALPICKVQDIWIMDSRRVLLFTPLSDIGTIKLTLFNG